MYVYIYIYTHTHAVLSCAVTWLPGAHLSNRLPSVDPVPPSDSVPFQLIQDRAFMIARTHLDSLKRPGSQPSRAQGVLHPPLSHG